MDQYIIGKKDEKTVDFPSQDLWIGAGNNYVLVLNSDQLKDLHEKIHLLLKANGGNY